MSLTGIGARPHSAVFFNQPLRNAIGTKRIADMLKLAFEVLATRKNCIDWRMRQYGLYICRM